MTGKVCTYVGVEYMSVRSVDSKALHTYVDGSGLTQITYHTRFRLHPWPLFARALLVANLSVCQPPTRGCQLYLLCAMAGLAPSVVAVVSVVSVEG